MKRLFVCLLFSSCSTIMWSHLLVSNGTDIDTIIHRVYETGPELKEQEYIQKRRLFRDSLFSYLVKLHKQHQEDILGIKDSVVVNFIVNGSGRIDSVWLVSPKTYPFKNIYKFIKDYDFKGPLMEFYTSKPELYDCTVKLVLLLNVEAKMLYIFFDCIRIRRSE